MSDDTPKDLPSRRELREQQQAEQRPAQQQAEPVSEPLATAPTPQQQVRPAPILPDPYDVRLPKRGGGRRWIIVTIVLVVILGLLAGAGAFVWNSYGDKISQALGWVQTDYQGDGTGQVLVTIKDGDIGEDIAQTLQDAGVVKTADAFYKLLLAQSPDPVFQPGVYQLKSQMSAQAALNALEDPASRVEHKVTLPEGLTGDETLQRISDATGIPMSDFDAAVADPTAYGLPADVVSMEGWLFPSTYTVDPRLTATDIVTQLVDQTVQVLDKYGVAPGDRERILTIASIVQREARAADDFPKVSAVIYNRLNADMLLQMDSTAQYAGSTFADGSVWTSSESLGDDNPWNTYVNPGLPIGPIANPGEQAIQAAVQPASGTWLYFVTVNLDTGETVFSDTLDEHDAAVSQLDEWCTANPGHGC